MLVLGLLFVIAGAFLLGTARTIVGTLTGRKRGLLLGGIVLGVLGMVVVFLGANQQNDSLMRKGLERQGYSVVGVNSYSHRADLLAGQCTARYSVKSHDTRSTTLYRVVAGSGRALHGACANSAEDLDRDFKVSK